MGLAQYSDNGLFAPRKIADTLRTTSDEVARSAGLGRDAVQRKDRVQSDKTQNDCGNGRNPEQGRTTFRFGTHGLCRYRSEPLAGFSGQTAMQLVLTGRASEVLDYIDAVDAGVHA